MQYEALYTLGLLKCSRSLLDPFYIASYYIKWVIMYPILMSTVLSLYLVGMSEVTSLWVFGYGSLVWKPGFQHGQTAIGTL